MESMQLVQTNVFSYFRYCPSCKNDENEIVKAGEKLKESKKKSKMASSTNQTSRDWGRVIQPNIYCIVKLSDLVFKFPRY